MSLKDQVLLALQKALDAVAASHRCEHPIAPGQDIYCQLGERHRIFKGHYGEGDGGVRIMMAFRNPRTGRMVNPS